MHLVKSLLNSASRGPRLRLLVAAINQCRVRVNRAFLGRKGLLSLTLLRHRHAVVLGERRVIAGHARAPGQGFGIRFFIVGPRERKMGENPRLAEGGG